jgi:hypothetical protein
MAITDLEEQTFESSKGIPANEKAKKLAKEKSKKEKIKYKTYYTQKGSKVLKVTFKKNGQYQEYIGNLSKKKENEILKLQIKAWSKEGIFIPEHQLDEVAEQKIKELNK